MKFSTIIFEKKEGVARITLNRPEALNAISPELISEIGVAADDAEKDESIKAIVIAAKGRAFSAGADLKAIKGILDSPHKIERFLRSWHKTFKTLEESSKPVICAVQGMALAGGLELVNACDIVIASDKAQLGDQHANFGLIPGGGNTQLLPRIVGPRKAKELLLTGDWLSAAEAERIGLINKVVPADKLEEAVNEMVDKVTKNKSPLAAKRIKELVNKGMQVDLHSAWELESQTMLNHFRSEDMAEGLSAFEERRTPVFKGR
ncbi:MAG: hypothetical protein COT13_04265 [Chloroflexi bacterium CG08_land_8_20_14_0_20_45_12]|nr:MAG: hypothetical protein AUK00_05510 [Dehalococcoidia bacterium CG2_30_46_9]PIU23206.1 MAG: hypothetical protein COT13_04265 [Chloroflexi bacterium CG08_land_8_20_14_0_20_45_12]